MLCTDKNVLGSDYETPLDAVQGGGRLEFTCLPPERDTMSTAWDVPSALWTSFPCTITPSFHSEAFKCTESERNHPSQHRGHARIILQGIDCANQRSQLSQIDVWDTTAKWMLTPITRDRQSKISTCKVDGRALCSQGLRGTPRTLGANSCGTKLYPPK